MNQFRIFAERTASPGVQPLVASKLVHSKGFPGEGSGMLEIKFHIDLYLSGTLSACNLSESWKANRG